MSQYNQFIYYKGNERLELETNQEPGIYAFIVYNCNKSFSQLSFPDNVQNDWVRSEYDNGDSTYNLLFRYEPAGTPTVTTWPNGTFNDPKLIFTIQDTGTLFTSDLTVDWVNNTSNTGTVSANPAFNDPYNREYTEFNEGSGSGDPHIKPMYNKHVYLIPNENVIYKYFDNQEVNERTIINVEMKVYSLDLIIFAEELLRRQYYDEYRKAKDNIAKFIPEQKGKYDSCFANIISVRYENEIIKFNIESMIVEEHINPKYIKITDLSISDNKYYKPKNIKGVDPDVKMRIITVPSNKYGSIEIHIYRDYERLNHRNHIELILKNGNKSNMKSCSGILIYLGTHDLIVPQLDYIGSIEQDTPKNIHGLKTVREYMTKQVKSELKKHRFLIRDKVISKDFTLLDGNF
jgi:hypothetical protein